KLRNEKGSNKRHSGFAAKKQTFGGATVHGPWLRLKSLNETASHTTQERSRPVSSPRLSKTGIFQLFSRDYRRIRPEIVQSWRLETKPVSSKARIGGHILGL